MFRQVWINKDDVMMLGRFTVLFFVIIFVFVKLYSETHTPTHSADEISEVETVPAVILTTAEVEAERQKLQPVTSTAELTIPDTLVVTEIADGELPADTAGTPAETANPPLPTVPGADEANETLAKNEDYVRPGSGIKFIKTGPAPKEEPQLVAVAFTGTIFSISTQNKKLTVAGNSSSIIDITFESDAKVMINNKEMNFADLKVGDIVYAEGYTEQNSGVLFAKIAAVTGTYQIIPL